MKRNILWIVMIIILALIWPFGVLKVERESASLEKGMAVSGPISENIFLIEAFTPTGKQLETISVRFSIPSAEEKTGTVLFQMMDQYSQVIYTENVEIANLKNNKYFDFSPKQKVNPRETYFFQISAEGYGDNAPAVYLGSKDTMAQEHLGMYFGGSEFANNTPIVKYGYKASLLKREALPYYIVTALLFILLLAAIPEEKSKKKVLFYFLFVVIAVCSILASDESKKPLTITADDLKRQAGGAEYDYIRIGEDSEYTGILANSSNFMLEEGAYTLGVEYRSDHADNTVSVYNNGSEKNFYHLSPEFTYQEFPLYLEKDSQDIVFRVNYNGTGNLSVTSLELTPEKRFYNDAYFYAGLFLIINAAAFLLIRNKLVQSLSSSSKVILLLVLGTGIFAAIPYFNGSLNWADDICYHLIRIEGIKDGLASGQFPVIIYPEGLKGNGYLNCMYPNLFLYIPAVLRLLGVSMAASYKFLIGLFHIGTAFASYYAVKTISKSQKAALLAAVLYTLSPYRFTNIYARGALGEILAMTFMPLLLAGLYHVLLGERNKWWILVLGVSGLIQTHVLSAVLGAIFCVVFGLIFCGEVFRERRYLEIGKAAACTLLINLWFIVPFLYFYKKGNLGTTALDWASFSEYSLQLSGLAGTLNFNDFRTLTLGIPILLCAGFAVLYLFLQREKDSTERFLVPVTILGGICTYMVIGQFPGWPLMNIKIIDLFLRNVQFAWRLLGPASILFIMAGTISLYRLKTAKPYVPSIFVLLVGIALLSASKYQEQDFAYKDYTATNTLGHVSKITGIPKGENTIVYPYEWRPAGTGDEAVRTQPKVSDETKTILLDYSRSGVKTKVTYNSSAENQTVTLPIIYYAGYKAYDEERNELMITGDSETNGIEIELIGDSQPHQIIVEYKGKWVFTIAFYISVFAAIGYPAYYVRKKRKQSNG